MPSIPQSLLWISLVVLWLFVLVPMLISKRDAVRRTSDVALATRVLNSGGGSRLLRRAAARGRPSQRSATGGRPTTSRRRRHRRRDVDDDARRTAAVVVAAAAVRTPSPTISTSTSSRRIRRAAGRESAARTSEGRNRWSCRLEFDEPAREDGRGPASRRGCRREVAEPRPVEDAEDEPQTDESETPSRRHRGRVRVRRGLVGAGGAVGHRPAARRLADRGAAPSVRVARPPRR